VYEPILSPLTWEGEAPAEPCWVNPLRPGGLPGGSPSRMFSHLLCPLPRCGASIAALKRLTRWGGGQRDKLIVKLNIDSSDEFILMCFLVSTIVGLE
jgi:hypothetical protein